MKKDSENDGERELVDPTLCEKCGFKNTPLCTHPDGYYQDEPAGLNKLIMPNEHQCPYCNEKIEIGVPNCPKCGGEIHWLREGSPGSGRYA